MKIIVYFSEKRAYNESMIQKNKKVSRLTEIRNRISGEAFFKKVSRLTEIRNRISGEAFFNLTIN
jgi:hypothetical protein